MYYDRDGEEITMDEWANLFENDEYKIVKKQTMFGNEVSTVWLGSDHGFGMAGKPIIFETMIFGGEWDQFEQRYATEEHALAAHNAIVNMIVYWHESQPEVEGWVKVKE